MTRPEPPIVHTDETTRPDISHEVRAGNTAVGCGVLILAFLLLWALAYVATLIIGAIDHA